MGEKRGMPEVDRNTTRRSWAILAQKFLLKPGHWTKKGKNRKKPSAMERSFTELRFASFLGSMVNDPGRRSRVEMNALAGALDPSSRITEHIVHSFAQADDLHRQLYDSRWLTRFPEPED
jgi:hypothetical protein